jgi:hypothetical protein
VAFAVFAAAGFEIASARAPLSTAAAPIEPGKYRLFIETSELRLVPGSYTLNLGMRSEAGDQDYIDAAACFDVTTNESAAMEFADSIRAATIPKIHASLSKLTGV